MKPLKFWTNAPKATRALAVWAYGLALPYILVLISRRGTTVYTIAFMVGLVLAVAAVGSWIVAALRPAVPAGGPATLRKNFGD